MAHPMTVLNKSRDILYFTFYWMYIKARKLSFLFTDEVSIFFYEFQEILMKHKIVIYEFEIEFES